MATVIDELIVSLGLDAKQFRQEADKANATLKIVVSDALRGSRDVEESLGKTHEATSARMKQGTEVGKQVANQFSNFKNQAAAFFGIVTTAYGFQQFIKNLTNTDAATGRLATRIGMSTKELSLWQEAAKRSGGSAEATGASFENMAQQFETLAITGTSPIVESMRGLGVAISDTSGKMRSQKDIFLDLSDKFKTMTPAQAQAWGARLGIDQGTITLLSKGRQEVEAILSQMERLGVASDADAKRAQEFENSMSDFQQSITSLGREVAAVFLPNLSEIVKQMAAWVAQNKEWISQEIGESIRGALVFLKGFAEGANAVAEAVGGWKNATEILFGLWLGSKVIGVIGSISRVLGLLAAVPGSGVTVATLAALGLAYEGFHISEGAGKEELDWEKQNKERLAREHPELVVPQINREPPSFMDNVRRWFGGSVLQQGIASTDMNAVQQGFLNTIAGPESKGRYDVLNGGEKFTDMSQHPGRVGAGGTSTAAGRYQFTKGTWDEYSKKLGLTDFSPKNQDRAAWALAVDRYRQRTGGDLEADVRAGDKTDKIAAALSPTWSSLPTGVESQLSGNSFKSSLSGNIGDAEKGNNAAALDHLRNNVPDSSKSWFKRLLSENDAGGGRQQTASSADTHMNGPMTINIHTAATDASGIAKSIGPALKQYAFSTQSNTGLA